MTCAEFRAPTVLAGVVAYPVAQARQVLEFYREFTAKAPDQRTVYAQLATDPNSGARLVGMAAFGPGDLAEGARALAPLRAFGTPLIDTIRTLPYPVWQQMFDPKYPHGRRYYWKANLLATLPDALLTTFIEQATEPPLPWLNATIEVYAGPMNRVGPPKRPSRTARRATN